MKYKDTITLNASTTYEYNVTGYKSSSSFDGFDMSSLLMIDRDSFKRLLGTAESLLAEKAKKMYTLSEQK